MMAIYMLITHLMCIPRVVLLNYSKGFAQCSGMGASGTSV